MKCVFVAKKYMLMMVRYDIYCEKVSVCLSVTFYRHVLERSVFWVERRKGKQDVEKTHKCTHPNCIEAQRSTLDKAMMMMMMMMLVAMMMMLMMMMMMLVAVANWQSREGLRHELAVRHSSFCIAASILSVPLLFYPLGKEQNTALWICLPIS